MYCSTLRRGASSVCRACSNRRCSFTPHDPCGTLDAPYPSPPLYHCLAVCLSPSCSPDALRPEGCSHQGHQSITDRIAPARTSPEAHTAVLLAPGPASSSMRTGVPAGHRTADTCACHSAIGRKDQKHQPQEQQLRAAQSSLCASTAGPPTGGTRHCCSASDTRGARRRLGCILVDMCTIVHFFLLALSDKSLSLIWAVGCLGCT